MKTLVCFGDSLTYGYGVSPTKVWHQLIKEKTGIRIINRGRNGDSLLGMACRLKGDVLESEADSCFFMAGSNDLIMGRALEDVFTKIKRIKEKISEKGIKTYIILPPPSIPEMAAVSWDSSADYNDFNQNIGSLGILLKEEFPTELIDIYSFFMNIPYGQRKSLYLDGVHLNGEGNTLFSNFLLENPIFRT